jgi:ribonuclease HI
MLKIATDGSCLKNPGGPIGWAWADEKGRWMSNGAPSGTNQSAELLALVSVLSSFPNTHLHLQLDSQYTLNIASKWMFSWARAGWKRTNGDIKNLEIIKVIYALMTERKTKGLQTKFEWVRGHLTDNRHPLNTVADLRAGEAARRAKQSKNLYGNYADSAGNPDSKKQAQISQLAAL